MQLDRAMPNLIVELRGEGGNLLTEVENIAPFHSGVLGGMIPQEIFVLLGVRGAFWCILRDTKITQSSLGMVHWTAH